MTVDRRVLDSTAEVATAAADLVADAVRGGIRTLVVTGGRTWRAAYGDIAGRHLPWGSVTVLFGDERCVGPAEPDSNFREVAETLLDRARPFGVIRIPGELGPEPAAAAYEPVVGDAAPLDLVLLAIGEDGHVASLFPGSPALASSRLVAPVLDAPKPPAERVTLTLVALRAARRVVILATGDAKADAVRKAAAGSVPAGRIPGAEWILDRAAAAGL